MPRLPSDSWYGLASSVATVETQLRYTPLHADRETQGLVQRLRALRASPYSDLKCVDKVGRFWLRAGLALALIGMLFRADVLLAAGLVVLTFAGGGWLWDRLSLRGLHYRRHLSETRAFLGETVTLTLEVHNQKLLPLPTLEITDSFPLELPVEGEEVVFNRLTHRGEFYTAWTPGVFQRLTRQYRVQCLRRGYHFFGPAKVTTGDGAGLFERTATLRNEQVLIIYPHLYSAADLRLPAKNPFGEWGSRERLFEDPLRFAGIREWQPGDGLRRIHWKATARHQQWLSRVYEPSEEPQVLIFLNVATQERYWEGMTPDLCERLISVAGSLAAWCAEQRLPVGLIANADWPGSDQTLRLLPGRSPNQLTHILEMLAAIDLPSRAIETHLLREAPRLLWGATLLVVTAVVHPELLDALSQLARAGRKLALFTLAESPPADLLPGVKIYHLPHLLHDTVAPVEVA